MIDDVSLFVVLMADNDVRKRFQKSVTISKQVENFQKSVKISKKV